MKKQKFTGAKIIIIFIHTILFKLFNSCQHYINYSELNYCLKVIDSTTFDIYNVLFFENCKYDFYCVLSKKTELSKDMFLNNNYEILIVDECYKIKLNRIDSTIVAKLDFNPTRQIDVYLYKSKIVWEQDTFKTTIFTTNEIKDKYFIK